MTQKIIRIGFIVLLGLPNMVTAKVSGPCVNCHTMHNSQAGLPMAFDLAGDDVLTPNSALLRTDCIGCHQGTNSDVADAPPYVLDTSREPTYGTGTGTDTLAGGNFYWVSVLGNDRAGHNVAGLDPDGDDGFKNKNIPGSSTPYSVATQVTCAGTSGCHGRNVSDEFAAISGGHHGSGGTALSDATKSYTSGSETDMSDAFRMLSGIKGIEDDDWEFTADEADHNLYSGAHQTNETVTISSLCAKCHGNFHNNSIGTASPWLRHPTDFDMSTLAIGSEYDGYDAYSLVAPVAVSSMSSTTNLQNIDHLGGRGGANGKAIVMCLSCHRAHGSPYDGILRWDYKNWPVSGVNGCAICHTSKN
jgi:predicted CXXCH cytochrome family protein